jgi:hypothetical protein
MFLLPLRKSRQGQFRETTDSLPLLMAMPDPGPAIDDLLDSLYYDLVV